LAVTNTQINIRIKFFAPILVYSIEVVHTFPIQNPVFHGIFFPFTNNCKGLEKIDLLYTALKEKRKKGSLTIVVWLT